VNLLQKFLSSEKFEIIVSSLLLTERTEFLYHGE